MKWIKLSERLPENNLFVFLKGCRLDKGVIDSDIIDGIKYIHLFEKNPFDSTVAYKVSSWINKHEELGKVFWLDERFGITIKVECQDHVRVVLTRENGDTYTSKSEELMDFLK